MTSLSGPTTNHKMLVRLSSIVCFLLLIHGTVAETNLGVAFAYDVSGSIQTQEMLTQELDFTKKFWEYLTDANGVDLSDTNIELAFFPFNEQVDFERQVVFDGSDIVEGSEMPEELVEALTTIAAANLTGLTNIPAVFTNIIENLRFENLPADPDDRHVVIFIISDFISSQNHDQMEQRLEEAATDKITAVAVALDKTRDDLMVNMFLTKGHEVIDLKNEVTKETFEGVFEPIFRSEPDDGSNSSDDDDDDESEDDEDDDEDN